MNHFILWKEYWQLGYLCAIFLKTDSWAFQWTLSALTNIKIDNQIKII